MPGRVRTFVRALDDVLNGGIPEGHVVLLCGPPGSMKSSLAYSILYRNALASKISSIYLSLEQSTRSMRDNVASLGMEHERVQTLLGIQDLGMVRKMLKHLDKRTWFDVFKLTFRNFQENWGGRILVLDSLQVFMLMSRFKQPREDLFHFFEWLRDLGLTSILVSEMRQDSFNFGPHGEDFLADGIIHLDMRREVNAVNLYLAIIKMRKTRHKRSYFPLLFEDGMFEIVVD